MCTKEKKVLLWSNYLNSQFGILWENARMCGNTGSKECDYYRALAEFSYLEKSKAEGAEKDRIKFKRPQLVFLCNHFAILFLTVEEGTLTGVTGENGSSSINLEGKTAAFRMSFTRTHVIGRDAKIDAQAANHEVRMVVFDFDKAVLTGVELKEDAVKEFFNAYLRLLRNAGHHVLFGLPDFTDSKILATLPIDYATVSKTVSLNSAEVNIDLETLEAYFESFTYHAITITQINEFIAVNQYGRAAMRAQAKRNVEASCIMDIKWSYDSKIYDVRFDSPRIVPLCPHELLFVLKVAELKEGEQVEYTFSEQVFVFVVNVSEFDGKVLKVDFRSARYHSYLSSLEITTTLHSEFLKYLEETYLTILTKHGYHIIYGATEDIARVLFKDGGFWRRVHNVIDIWSGRRHSEAEIWVDRSQYTSSTLVNQFFALSERSVERLLRLKWRLQQENRTFDRDNFSSTFSSTKPLRIRLLSNSKMVVTVEIEKGELKPRSQAQTHSSSTRVAPSEIFMDEGVTEEVTEIETNTEPSRHFKGFVTFEVSLEVNTETDGDEISFEFILDMRNAQRQETLTDLWDTMTNQQVDEATSKTICDFVQLYILELQIRKQVSLGKIKRKKNVIFSMTVAAEREISIENIHSSQSEESNSDTSLLIIYGMTRQSEDDVADVSFKWSSGLLPSLNSDGIGTVWISGRHFINNILEIFGEFNSKTTIVRENGGATFVTLKVREEGSEPKPRKPYMLDTELTDSRCLVYSWDHHYNVTRREIGSHTKHTWDALILRTQNHVWIPTRTSAKGNQTKIALTGEHEICASQKGLPDAVTRVTWTVVIIITYTSSGLEVSTTEPRHNTTGAQLEAVPNGTAVKEPYDAKALLEDKIETLIQETKDAIADHFSRNDIYKWFDLDAQEHRFSNPIFTRGSDLVYEVYATGEDPSEEQGTRSHDSGGPGGPSGGAGGGDGAGARPASQTTDSTPSGTTPLAYSTPTRPGSTAGTRPTLGGSQRSTGSRK